MSNEKQRLVWLMTGAALFVCACGEEQPQPLIGIPGRCDYRKDSRTYWITPETPASELTAIMQMETIISLYICSLSQPGQLELPNLLEIEKLYILKNQKLQNLSFPVLSRLSVLEMSDNQGLHTLQLPSLSEPGMLNVWYNNNLQELSFPSVTKVDSSIVVISNPAMLRISFPVQTEAAGFGARDNQALTTIEMPSMLVFRDILEITENPSLAQIGFSSLTSAGTVLRITDNPSLPQCQVDALVDQLHAAGWSGAAETHGNDDAATCP